ncbi:phage holin family protein [Rubrivirga sp.]|uniref:phage holin family protein n=1 Tax=Rubrivirga sp. TaxID=1885344 RepID=UPI003B525082
MADSRTPPKPTVEPGTVAIVEGGAARPPAADDRSLGDLLSELSTETTTLVKQEVRLAKAEARQEIHEAGKGIGAAVAGGAVAYTGLIALVIGLGWGLGELLDGAEWLGITIAGVVVALIGYVLLKKGLDQLKALSPPLDTTVQTLQEDKQWIKAETR